MTLLLMLNRCVSTASWCRHIRLSAFTCSCHQQGPVGKRPALFVYNRAAGCYWLNSGLACSQQLQAAFCFAGWLMAQALCNRAMLGVPLAPLLCCKLLSGSSFEVGEQQLPKMFNCTSALQHVHANKCRDLWLNPHDPHGFNCPLN